MRKYLFLPSVILVAVLFYLPPSERTEAAQAAIPDSNTEIVRVTENGIEPNIVTIQKDQGVAFFLNETPSSSLSMELDLRGHDAGCDSVNFRADSDGLVRSDKPIAPGDFASTCFHDPGTYNFTVFGLNQNPDGIKGQITVE